jgi:putative transposase
MIRGCPDPDRDEEAARDPRCRYPTDLTDAEWQLLAPLIPTPKPGGRLALHDRRELVNAMDYWLRAGCVWRLLPHDLPPWQTVYHYFRGWRQQGLWEQVHGELRAQERVRQGGGPPPAQPSWTARASRSLNGGPHGYDGAKRLNGRKRHLLVDTLGLICKLQVTAADVGDRDGAAQLLRRLDRRRFPRLRHGWVDGSYRGPFLDWDHQHRRIAFQVVSRSDGGRKPRWLPPGATPPIVSPFTVVPRRRVVERTFAWLGRYRRLSKDYEYLTATSEAVIYLAMIRLLLRRLTHP